MRWGLVSPSAKEPKLAPINARAETIATTPLFRDAFRRQGCLMVAGGFYESRTDVRGKTPHLIHPALSHPRSASVIARCVVARRTGWSSAHTIPDKIPITAAGGSAASSSADLSAVLRMSDQMLSGRRNAALLVRGRLI